MFTGWLAFQHASQVTWLGRGLHPKGCLHAGGVGQTIRNTTGHGQQVGGTHPTGMHSCCSCLLFLITHTDWTEKGRHVQTFCTEKLQSYQWKLKKCLNKIILSFHSYLEIKHWKFSKKECLYLYLTSLCWPLFFNWLFSTLLLNSTDLIGAN